MHLHCYYLMVGQGHGRGHMVHTPFNRASFSQAGSISRQRFIQDFEFRE